MINRQTETQTDRKLQVDASRLILLKILPKWKKRRKKCLFCCRDLDIIPREWWSRFKRHTGGIWTLWGYGIWERQKGHWWSKKTCQTHQHCWQKGYVCWFCSQKQLYIWPRWTCISIVYSTVSPSLFIFTLDDILLHVV